MLNLQQFMTDFPYKSKCQIDPICYPPFTIYGKTKEDIYNSWIHDIKLMLLINEPAVRKMHVSLLNDINTAIESGIICIYHLSYNDNITHQYTITIEETDWTDIEKEATRTNDDGSKSIFMDYTFIRKYGNCAIHNRKIHFEHDKDSDTAYMTSGSEYMYTEDLLRSLLHNSLKKEYVDEITTKISTKENMVLTNEYFTLSNDTYDYGMHIIFK